MLRNAYSTDRMAKDVFAVMVRPEAELSGQAAAPCGRLQPVSSYVGGASARACRVCRTIWSGAQRTSWATGDLFMMP